MEGLGSSTRLRCRLAGHYLPVHTVRWNTNAVSWNGRGGVAQVVIDVDVTAPAGFLPLEGVAMLETIVAHGPHRGLPAGCQTLLLHPRPGIILMCVGMRLFTLAFSSSSSSSSSSSTSHFNLSRLCH